VKRRAILVAVTTGLFAAIVWTGGRDSSSARAQQGAGGAAQGSDVQSARPVVVVETSRGRFEFELYPEDAPRSVEHILTLVRRGFYDGHRVHRVEPEFVVQFGDPYSKDLDRKNLWGRGGSGKPIGVAEISPKHTHKVGAVALAYAGHPMLADSQIYIILADTERSRRLDGEYAVIGQITQGMDVVQQIRQLDVIEKVTIK
jgi:peptidyl-prolyl cis-trans isomerase B (cyclophilin B)